MKKYLSGSLITAVLLAVSILAPTKTAHAVAPNWDVTGTYDVNVKYLGVDYPETLVLAQSGASITGTSLNTNPVTAGGAFTITAGSVDGDVVDFTATNNDDPSLTDHFTGTVSGDGSISGDWNDVDPGTRSGTWATTNGNAASILPPTPPNPAPVTNPATLIGTSTATLNATNDAATSADDTSFWWGTTLAGPFATPADFPLSGWFHDSGLGAQPAGAPFSNALTGLTPKTTYYFTSWAHSSGVWYPDTTPPLTFTTLGIAQTITPASHAASAVYGSTFSVSATSDSALPVDITAEGGCTIDSGIVTMTSGTDSCVLHYNQAGNDVYDSATQVDETVTASPKALTITGLTANNKVYDNTNTATLSGVATLGASEDIGTGSSDDGLPYTGDTVNVLGGTATFANKNVGNNKTVTASGFTSSNTNYTITAPTGLKANITPLAITVTAVTDTKTYDATTISLAAPTISPSIIAGDVGLFWETFNTSSAGTGKTLTPHSIILDGNGGHNYAVTYVTDTTGVISKRAITITADSGQGKIFGGADPALTYHVTNGFVIGFHVITGHLTRVAGENVGTYAINQGTLTAGNNYAITFVGANFAITPADAPITINAVDLNQDYNGTPRSVGATTVPEEVSYSITYDGGATAPTNAGAYSVVATITDPNYTGSASATLTIHKVNPTVVVTPYNVAYDANAHTATGSAVGVQEESLSGLDLSNTVHTNVGNYIEDSYSFTDSTGNYNNVESTTITDTIGTKAQTITFGALSDKIVGDANFTVSASASSGLSITFTASGNCSITENTVSITAEGSCTITAHQAGDENIAAAEDVSQSFDINSKPTAHHSGSIVGGGNGGGGQVLGASTGPEGDNGTIGSCPAFLKLFIKFGAKNDVEQVVRLQIFLNEHEGEKLAVNGTYDIPTFEAVKRFQVKYKETVLKPWTDAGLTFPDFPTGFVYKTTEWTINNLMCGGSGFPLPPLS